MCVRPLCNRLEAIQRLKPPTTVKGCRSFARMVNLLSIFCPDLQELLKLIYDLTRKDRQFVWLQELQLTFDEIKNNYKSHQYYIYLMLREDFTYTQILVSMLWEVFCTKFEMVNQS